MVSSKFEYVFLANLQFRKWILNLSNTSRLDASTQDSV